MPYRTSPLCYCCQVLALYFVEVGFSDDLVRAVVADRIVVQGPGVACPKCRRAGGEPAALGAEALPGWPPRALAAAFRVAGCAGGAAGPGAAHCAPCPRWAWR